MKTYTVNLPHSLDLSSIKFAQKLQKLPEADKYILDFQRLEWVEPFGMLFVANAIRKAREVYPGKTFVAESFNNERLSYAAHMGFFQAIGLNFGKLPGEARGNEHYLPITVLEVAELEQEAARQYRDVGHIIEHRSKKLAQILTQQSDGHLVEILGYSFREIIRNVVEHSNSDTLQYCAQYWPTKCTVEIAILDTGIGVKASLSENPDIQVETHRQALNLSLMPGISGKVHKGTSNPYDVWQNAGFGLYITSRLCGNGGSFLICSGDTGITIQESNKRYYKTNFSGTSIRLRLHTGHNETLQQLMKRFLQEGDEIAKKYTKNNQMTASKASRMISNYDRF